MSESSTFTAVTYTLNSTRSTTWTQVPLTSTTIITATLPSIDPTRYTWVNGTYTLSKKESTTIFSVTWFNFANTDPVTTSSSSKSSSKSSHIATSTATSSDTKLSAASKSTTTLNPSASVDLTRSPELSGSHVSNGAIAGASVGCLIAGLLLGAFITFLFLRRRPNKGNNRIDTPRVVVKEKSSSPPESGLGDINLGHFILDSTPDSELSLELQSLGNLIQIHVDNNYHSQPVQISHSTLSMDILSLGLPQATAKIIASLCIDPETRAAALRHVICHASFASIDIYAKSPISLLPEPFIAFLHSLPSAQKHPNNSAEVSLALSKWRQLSALLLHTVPNDRSPLVPSEATTGSQVEKMTLALNTVLHHFAFSPQMQTKHLQSVLFEIAKFGYLLLSQPSDWKLSYKIDNEEELVMCAGLLKLSHRDGTPYSQPQLVQVPEVL